LKENQLYVNNNSRHKQDFDKLKTSKAMKTLLEADDALARKAKVVSGA
jgi:hypothetical protein